MVGPIIITKIITPQKNPLAIRRDRLYKHLYKSDHARLIFISAPAGYGKTSLVREWLQETDKRVAWFSIESSDNDVTQFLFYLLSALHYVFPNSFLSLIGAIKENEDFPPEQVVSGLVNEVTALGRPIWIVLDDYHFIENQRIHELITALTDHLPGMAQIIITSRNAPPFPVHRWRATNQLLEINSQDLMFNYSEAEEFLNNVMGLRLSANELQIIHNKSDGWATALQLVAMAMPTFHKHENQRRDILNTISSDHPFVLEYLNEEVLRQQPSNIRWFLLRTSILERFSAQLCNAILGINNSADILAYLEKHNLFIIPLDDTHHWFRYHPLFAGLLQNALQGEDQSEIQNLHLRSSQWFAQNGAYYEAITHALASKKPSELIQIAENIMFDLIASGTSEACRHWLPLIPIEIIRKRPLLCLAQASSISFTDPFDYDRIEFWALQAKKADPEIFGEPISDPKIPYNTMGEFVDVQIAWLQTSLARLRGKSPTKILQTAEAALKLTSNEDYTVSSSLWMAISRAYLNLGKSQKAERAIQQALFFSEMSDSVSRILITLWTQTYIAYWQGQFTKALQIYKDAEERFIAPAVQNGEYLSPASSIFTFKASILRELNQLDLAKDYFRKSQSLTQYRDLSDISLDNQIGMAWINIYQGKEECITELENIIPKLPSKKQNMVLLHISKMRLYLGEHRPDLVNKAFHWLNEQHSSWKPMQNLENVYLEWVRALLLRKRHGESVPDLSSELVHLEKQYQFAKEAHYLRSQVWIRILQALIYQDIGNSTAAIQSINDALLLAEPEGFVRTFIDAGSSIIPLLKAALNNQITPRYSKHLLNSFSTANFTPLSGKTPQPTNKHITSREKEVLLWVARGLSNQQIAEKLVLSQGTIKKYLSSVYQKLNVHRRTQAILKAKELGIL